MRILDYDAAREILAKVKINGQEVTVYEPMLEQVMQVEQMRLDKGKQLKDLEQTNDFRAMSEIEWEMMRQEITILVPGIPPDAVMRMTVRQRKDLLELLNSTETRKEGAGDENPPTSQE